MKCFSSFEGGTTHDNDEINPRMILDSSLQFVPQYGWSVRALEEGAKAINMPGITHGIFPKEGFELIQHFESDCNTKLENYLKDVSTREDDPYVYIYIVVS